MSITSMRRHILMDCRHCHPGGSNLEFVTVRTGNGGDYNRYMELSPLLGVKIVHLVDRTDVFKISNLVYGGRETVTSLYSSLQGQRQFMAGIVS
jgi:hypothetical protein